MSATNSTSASTEFNTNIYYNGEEHLPYPMGVEMHNFAENSWGRFINFFSLVSILSSIRMGNHVAFFLPATQHNHQNFYNNPDYPLNCSIVGRTQVNNQVYSIDYFVLMIDHQPYTKKLNAILESISINSGLDVVPFMSGRQPVATYHRSEGICIERYNIAEACQVQLQFFEQPFEFIGVRSHDPY